MIFHIIIFFIMMTNICKSDQKNPQQAYHVIQIKQFRENYEMEGWLANCKESEKEQTD